MHGPTFRKQSLMTGFSRSRLYELIKAGELEIAKELGSWSIA